MLARQTRDSRSGGQMLGYAVVARAILDRLLHHSHAINNSWRKLPFEREGACWPIFRFEKPEGNCISKPFVPWVPKIVKKPLAAFALYKPPSAFGYTLGILQNNVVVFGHLHITSARLIRMPAQMVQFFRLSPFLVILGSNTAGQSMPKYLYGGVWLQ